MLVRGIAPSRATAFGLLSTRVCIVSLPRSLHLGGVQVCLSTFPSLRPAAVAGVASWLTPLGVVAIHLTRAGGSRGVLLVRVPVFTVTCLRVQGAGVTFIYPSEGYPFIHPSI